MRARAATTEPNVLPDTSLLVPALISPVFTVLCLGGQELASKGFKVRHELKQAMVMVRRQPSVSPSL